MRVQGAIVLLFFCYAEVFSHPLHRPCGADAAHWQQKSGTQQNKTNPSPLRPQPYYVHYIIIFHDNAIFASYKRNKGQQYCQHRDSLHQLHHIPQRKVLRSKQHRQHQRQPYPAEGHGRQLPMAQSAAKDAGGGSQPYLLIRPPSSSVTRICPPSWSAGYRRTAVNSPKRSSIAPRLASVIRLTSYCILWKKGPAFIPSGPTFSAKRRRGRSASPPAFCAINLHYKKKGLRRLPKAFVSMGYKKDIFAVFAYEFELLHTLSIFIRFTTII